MVPRQFIRLWGSKSINDWHELRVLIELIINCFLLQGLCSSWCRTCRRFVRTCSRLRHRHCWGCRRSWHCSTASTLCWHDSHPHFCRSPRSLRSHCRHLPVHKIKRENICRQHLNLFTSIVVTSKLAFAINFHSFGFQNAESSSI